jgi:hypothetical protein
MIVVVEVDVVPSAEFPVWFYNVTVNVSGPSTNESWLIRMSTVFVS